MRQLSLEIHQSIGLTAARPTYALSSQKRPFLSIYSRIRAIPLSAHFRPASCLKNAYRKQGLETDNNEF